MTFVLVEYQTAAGKRPFNEWLNKLYHRDKVAAVAVDARLSRIRDYGNFGDHRCVGHPVYELRLHLGPGYRVYYALHEHVTVLLLVGGQKGDQQRDIAKAHAYFEEFRRRL